MSSSWKIPEQSQTRRGPAKTRREKFYDTLFDGLRELGYQEGRNLLVERRYAEGHNDRFREFAAGMVRLKVDVIIVSTTPAGSAVKSPSTNIPVVFPTRSVRSRGGLSQLSRSLEATSAAAQVKPLHSAPSIWKS